VHGRYCHVCGQENTEAKETFWHLLTHFVYDITHFDGKFFSTLKYLLFRPGYLSEEYLRGKRMSYLNPIRMYVFTSAFFFLIIFNVNKHEEAEVKRSKKMTVAEVKKELTDAKDDLVKNRDEEGMSIIAKHVFDSSIHIIDADLALLAKDSTAVDRLRWKDRHNEFMGATEYQSVEQYENVQKALPTKDRDSWLGRKVMKQNLYLKEKYKDDDQSIWKHVVEKMLHLFPQLLFVSLPLFALLLQLMYIHHRNKYYYVNHIIYTIHLYCAIFIIILLSMLVQYIFHLLHWHGAGTAGLFFTLAGYFYWYKSMRNFYMQGRGKTILKFAIMNVLTFFLLILLTIVFFIFSMFTM